MDIAQKYARAFLHVHQNAVTPSQIENMADAVHFLRTHRRAFFLLQVPMIPHEVKYKGLIEWSERLKLGNSIKSLISLLLSHKRAHILARILNAIVHYYREQNGLELVTITTTSLLTPEQQKMVEKFIVTQYKASHQPEKKCSYRYVVDSALIAGIRIASNTILWEYSVAKQLRDCYQAGRE